MPGILREIISPNLWVIKHAPGHSKSEIIISNHDPEFQRQWGEAWTEGWQPQKNTHVSIKWSWIMSIVLQHFLVFLLFWGFADIWVEANSEFFLGWSSWSYTRATDRRKSQIWSFQFFKNNFYLLLLLSLNFVTLPWRPAGTANSRLLFLSFQKFQWVYSKRHHLKTGSKRHQSFLEDSLERPDAETSPIS